MLCLDKALYFLGLTFHTVLFLLQQIHVNNSKIAQYFLSDNKALLQIVTFNFSPDIYWEKGGGVGCKLKYPPQVITFLPEFLWYVRMS